jgi:hypothetical protein
MRREAMAERLLALFVGRVKAASVLGDLAEERGERGARWFWWSYADILFAAAWRPVAAIGVAFATIWYGGRYVAGPNGMVGYTPVEYIAFSRASWLADVVSIGAISTFLFAYSWVRFGSQDRMARLALGFAVTGVMVAWFSFVPVVPWMAAAAYVILCGVALASRKGRRSLAAIGAACAVVVVVADRFGTWLMMNSLRNHWFKPASWTGIYLWLAIFYFVGLGTSAFVCARMHREVAGG